MSARMEWFEVTTLGSRGAARVVPAALAPGGVQVEFEFATGRHLIVTFTASEAGELIDQLAAALDIGEVAYRPAPT